MKLPELRDSGGVFVFLGDFKGYGKVAVAVGAPPFLAAMSLGVISALFGGLTHYATGPSPIFFGSGYIPQGTWWKIGFVMSVINLIIFVGIGSMWWKIAGLW